MKKLSFTIGFALFGLFYSAPHAYALTPVQNSFPTSPFTQELSLGSSGSQVELLQIVLESEGLLSMPAGVKRGYFGALTKAAFLEYQKRMGINSGVFDLNTRTLLNRSAPVTTESPISILTLSDGDLEDTPVAWESTDGVRQIFWGGGRSDMRAKVSLINQSNNEEYVLASDHRVKAQDGKVFGSFSFNPAEFPNIQSDQKYLIRVCQQTNCSTSARPFIYTKDPSVTILTPTHAMKWKAGTKKTIKWDTSDGVDVDYVRIVVIKTFTSIDCVEPCVGLAIYAPPILDKTNINNIGQYKWSIPKGQKGNFNMTIIGYKENGVKDTMIGTSKSVKFTIVD